MASKNNFWVGRTNLEECLTSTHAKLSPTHDNLTKCFKKWIWPPFYSLRLHMDMCHMLTGVNEGPMHVNTLVCHILHIQNFNILSILCSWKAGRTVFGTCKSMSPKHAFRLFLSKSQKNAKCWKHLIYLGAPFLIHAFSLHEIRAPKHKIC